MTVYWNLSWWESSGSLEVRPCSLWEIVKKLWGEGDLTPDICASCLGSK